jgi:3',5'-cyclic AMP phosphodiesterase CpdA
MTKIIWLSDLHFTSEGSVLGHDPRIRVQAAIDFINTHHSDANHCLISGDLVNRGTVADYSALTNILKTLTIPVHPMAGNHDDRTLLRNHFDLPKTTMSDFVQYDLTMTNARVICIDTKKTGADGGEFCAERSNWLDLQLQQNPDTPTYLFLHHPPQPLGLPMQDTDCMENGAAFLDLISKYTNVKHLFIGHVHRPITGTLRGIPFATMRSVLYQAPPPQPDWTWDTFAPAPEAPQLGVIQINGTDCQLHYTQFCDFQKGT